MVAVACQVVGCKFTTPAPGTAAAQVALLHHVTAEHPEIIPAAARDYQKNPPLERLTVELGCSPPRGLSLSQDGKGSRLTAISPPPSRHRKPWSASEKSWETQLTSLSSTSTAWGSTSSSLKRSRLLQYSPLQQDFGEQKRTPPANKGKG